MYGEPTYLEAEMKYKILIVPGPEFGKLQSHILVIHKALYELRSSGARCHYRLYHVLYGMDLIPSIVWMRCNKDQTTYEIIAV